MHSTYIDEGGPILANLQARAVATPPSAISTCIFDISMRHLSAGPEQPPEPESNGQAAAGTESAKQEAQVHIPLPIGVMSFTCPMHCSPGL